MPLSDLANLTSQQAATIKGIARLRQQGWSDQQIFAMDTPSVQAFGMDPAPDAASPLMRLNNMTAAEEAQVAQSKADLGQKMYDSEMQRAANPYNVVAADAAQSQYHLGNPLLTKYLGNTSNVPSDQEMQFWSQWLKDYMSNPGADPTQLAQGRMHGLDPDTVDRINQAYNTDPQAAQQFFSHPPGQAAGATTLAGPIAAFDTRGNPVFTAGENGPEKVKVTPIGGVSKKLRPGQTTAIARKAASGVARKVESIGAPRGYAAGKKKITVDADGEADPMDDSLAVPGYASGYTAYTYGTATRAPTRAPAPAGLYAGQPMGAPGAVAPFGVMAPMTPPSAQRMPVATMSPAVPPRPYIDHGNPTGTLTPPAAYPGVPPVARPVATPPPPARPFIDPREANGQLFQQTVQRQYQPAFGSRIGSANYNPALDLNHDGMITIGDVARAGMGAPRGMAAGGDLASGLQQLAAAGYSNPAQVYSHMYQTQGASAAYDAYRQNTGYQPPASLGGMDAARQQDYRFNDILPGGAVAGSYGAPRQAFTTALGMASMGAYAQAHGGDYGIQGLGQGAAQPASSSATAPLGSSNPNQPGTYTSAQQTAAKQLGGVLGSNAMMPPGMISALNAGQVPGLASVSPTVWNQLKAQNPDLAKQLVGLWQSTGQISDPSEVDAVMGSVLPAQPVSRYLIGDTSSF
ncbi:MAG: hypothetical protein KGK07_12835 [Chloroflexota bacterium]|nr:hypothetical protein [Chloroflexota bacterium]